MAEAQISDKQNRLAEEPLGRLLLSLSIPAIIAQIVNLLYNVVDRVYVGRIPGTGSLSLAALGVCVPILQILLAFAALIGQGASPRAGIAMGKNNYDEANRLMGSSFVLLTVLSIALGAVFAVFRRPLLLLFGASANTIDAASAYLGTYLLGTPFVMWVFGLNVFITVQGFTKISMATVLIGCVLNIILDPIFIYGLGMGVRGAALATVVSQGVSAVWVIVFLCSKRSSLKLAPKWMRLDRSLVGMILSLGISPFVMYSTESLVQIIYNSGMQFYGGDLHVAAMSVIFSVHMIIFLPVSGLSSGAVPIISYNYGARNFDRVRKAFGILLGSCLAFTLAAELPIELFPRAFFSIFNDDPSLWTLGANPLRVFVFASIFMAAQNSVQNTFLAIGEAKSSIFIAMLRKIVLLIPLALVLPRIGGLGTWGLILAEPVSDTISATTSYILFKRKSRQLLA